MPEKLDLTKQYIEIPNFYTYTEKWCDKNIREVHDLDLICKTKDAEYELCRFLEEIGSGMYLIIKKFLKDHRVFMTSVGAALAFGGKWQIHDKDSINTSFPNFLKIINELK